MRLCRRFCRSNGVVRSSERNKKRRSGINVRQDRIIPVLHLPRGLVYSVALEHVCVSSSRFLPASWLLLVEGGEGLYPRLEKDKSISWKSSSWIVDTEQWPIPAT